MNSRSIILLVLMWWGHVMTQVGVVAGKANPEAVYSAQAGALVYQAVSVAFLKTPGRPGDVLVTVTFQLDRRAHVQNLAILPEGRPMGGRHGP